jgi:bifunctional DNase/RNase
MLCSETACPEQAVFHITWAEMRKCVREQHLCEQHAQMVLTNLRFDNAFRFNATGTAEGARCFDVCLLVISEIHPQQAIYLREVETDKYFPLLIGIFEATSIDRLLKGFRAPRPLTHDTAYSIISALGGRLEDVFFSNMENEIHFAELRIRQNLQHVSVDARPSDAINLAIQSNVPIFISEKSLRQIKLP